MPKPNIELLEKVLKHIEDHPETWDQDAWRTAWDGEALETDDMGETTLSVNCGTAFCFAGWACQLEGARWADPACLIAVDDDRPEERLTNGTVFASDRARRLLGLTISQSNRLFAGWNTLDDIREIVAAIKAEAE